MGPVGQAPPGFRSESLAWKAFVRCTLYLEVMEYPPFSLALATGHLDIVALRTPIQVENTLTV